ncbi:Na/Pi cotransporter family protein [Enterovibrio coralii]|uniref:Sodium-dependent phosphate transporter n=1 Tax=Enterovibrio coralii TaxID=294935 RepID=A0A135ICS8_9GAMM|nr:Na/Pi cotransporter family protein [Enterovibrio coralii]KXF83144.1 sodium-dependent phosphate transporter [Enterovibrio coralii]
MTGTSILFNLLGGVALLLFSLNLVKKSVLKAFGGKIRRSLGRSVFNRWRAFGVGLGVTCLLQSSTATALLASSLANQGLATASGLAILLGADVGTTLVAKVLTFDLSWLQPLFFIVGIVLMSASKRDKHQHIGSIAIGIGLMLLALNMIVSVSIPIRDSFAIQSMMTALNDEPFLAIIVGMSIAFMVHSSLATVLLVIAMASAGVITTSGGIPLILGANLGAAIPAVINTLNSSPSIYRIPLGNLMFRAVGVALTLPLLNVISSMSFFYGNDPAIVLVNFHMLFNVVIALSFLPLVKPCARLLEAWFPDVASETSDNSPRYLDRKAFRKPSVALTNSVREVLRMGDLLKTMLDGAFEVLKTRDCAELKNIKRSDDLIDEYHEKINWYLTELSRQDLPKKYRRRCFRISSYTTNLEHAGDILECSMTDVIEKMIQQNVQLPDFEKEAIEELKQCIYRNMELAFSVLLTGDVNNARALIEQKSVVKSIERKATLAHQKGLRDSGAPFVSGSSLYLDLLRDLIRVNSHFSSIAYPILDQAGELSSSRLKKARPLDVINARANEKRT